MQAVLGQTYTNLGEHEKAKILLKNSLKIMERFFGDEHVQVGKANEAIGKLQIKTQKYDQAQQSFQKARLVYERHYSYPFMLNFTRKSPFKEFLENAGR